MAAETLCTRWTMVLVREMVAGSTRFNDLRRGVPRMSPSLLSQRLKELEVVGIITRTQAADEPSVHEYRLTEAGRDLQAVVEAFGLWGQKWIQTQATLKNLDPSLLMWDMRRNLDPSPLPARRTVINFSYPELAAARRNWWLVVDPTAEVDLCSADPGYDVDLWVTTDLRTMTAIWMGLSRVADVGNKIQLDGDPAIAQSMQTWLGLSPFSVQPKLVH
jgi:DNA-binding HxlR family transcriptional regulator